MKDNYTLEFHPDQRGFHYNNGQHKKNTFGWEVIAENQPEVKLSLFTFWCENHFGTDIEGRLIAKTGQLKWQWKQFNTWYEYLKSEGAIIPKH